MKAWGVQIGQSAARKLRKLDPQIPRELLLYVQGVADSGNPRSKGKPLEGDMAGLWRYRVRDWRVIVLIEDHIITITVIDVGHRSEIYRN